MAFTASVLYRHQPGQLQLNDVALSFRFESSGKTLAVELSDIKGVEASKEKVLKVRAKLGDKERSIKFEFYSRERRDEWIAPMQHVVLHGKPPTPVFTEADSVSVERPSVLVGDDTKDMTLGRTAACDAVQTNAVTMARTEILVRDPELAKSYRLLVDQGPLSNEEFWRAHQRQVDEEVAGNQAVGRSNARPELKRIAGAANHLEVTVTHDFIRDTFQKYPGLEQLHRRMVPQHWSEEEFWGKVTGELQHHQTAAATATQASRAKVRALGIRAALAGARAVQDDPGSKLSMILAPTSATIPNTASADPRTRLKLDTSQAAAADFDLTRADSAPVTTLTNTDLIDGSINAEAISIMAECNGHSFAILRDMGVQTTRSNATDIFRDMTNSIDVASDLTTHTKQEFVQIDLTGPAKPVLEAHPAELAAPAFSNATANLVTWLHQAAGSDPPAKRRKRHCHSISSGPGLPPKLSIRSDASNLSVLRHLTRHSRATSNAAIQRQRGDGFTTVFDPASDKDFKIDQKTKEQLTTYFQHISELLRHFWASVSRVCRGQEATENDVKLAKLHQLLTKFDAKIKTEKRKLNESGRAQVAVLLNPVQDMLSKAFERYEQHLGTQ